MTGNSVSDAMIRRAGELIRKGEIPDDVTLELLWAGMVARSEVEARRDKTINSMKVTIGVVGGTLTIYGAVLVLMAKALLDHLSRIGG